MIDWRKNLAVLWAIQVLSLMGFSFALPFAPLYLQELGIRDQESLRLWSGLFMAASGIPLAVMMPIWGLLSDRWGRKPMTLRAMLGGSLALLGMGLVRSPQMLIVLRVLQGAFSGTVVANLTLVVSNTPEKRLGFAIGIMNSAVFTGNAIGPLVGGTLSDALGFRIAFLLSSGTLLLAFLIGLIWVKEQFTPQAAASRPRLLPGLQVLIRENRILGYLGLFALFGLARYSPRPMYPLLVKEIASPWLGVATQAGLVSAVSGVAAVLSGIAVGRLADRGRPFMIGVVCALAAAVFILPQGFVPAVWYLLPLCFLADFFSGGLDPILNVLLSRKVSVERRGAAFGLSGSARSMGWSAGALAGGALAAWLGFVAVFAGAALLFLLAALLLARLHRAAGRPGAPEARGRPGGSGAAGGSREGAGTGRGRREAGCTEGGREDRGRREAGCGRRPGRGLKAVATGSQGQTGARLRIVAVSESERPALLEEVRSLFREYAASLGFDLAFQDFEAELEGLPGDYAPPQGRLYMALIGGAPAGCIALRPLDRGACEMKRLYVRARFRGRGIGRSLSLRLIREAAAAGYRCMRLDTITSMSEALSLYRSLGFREIPPYRFNPIPGALYLELDLGRHS